MDEGEATGGVHGKIAPSIDDDELFRVLDDNLHQLFLQLSTASSKIESVQKKESSQRRSIFARASNPRVSRAGYIWKKEAINEATRNLEEWQKRFDPSWYFLLRIADPLIDQELQRSQPPPVSQAHGRSRPNAAKNPLGAAMGIRAALVPGQQRSVFLEDSSMDIRPIPYSEAKLGRLVSANDSKWYIINTISSRPGIPSKEVIRDVRQLATKLSQADPLAFGLLYCKGAMSAARKSEQQRQSNDQGPAIEMIFRIPENADRLSSLREMLLASPAGISHTQRLRIACELAKSVSFLHTFDFVHKNIRPESILCFKDSQKSNTFLVGFDAFRAASGNTNLAGDYEWDRNIYRHPERQGVYLTAKYRMEHDIYSLGVCLLEIGLWESLVLYADDGAVLQAGGWYKDLQAWLQEQGLGLPDNYRWASTLKEYLVHLAQTKLPIRMGDKYTQAVLACLTCLDETDLSQMSLRDSRSSTGSTQVALRFVEDTLFRLNEIST